MKKNVEWILGSVFFAVGSLVTVIGLILCLYHFNFINNAVEGTAIITHIDRYRDSDGDASYTVHVKYTIEDQEYNTTLGFYNSNMYEGKEITIYYKPDQPWRVRINESIIVGLVLVILGLVFLILGLVFIIRQTTKSKLRKRLLEAGRIVYADISEITLNQNYTVNRMHPYNIKCNWTDPDTGLFYFFKSDNLWFDPEPIIQEKGITTLSVYLDSEDPKKYFVSVENIEMFVGSY